MEHFIIRYQSIFYWAWPVILFIRMELNKYIYRKIDNETINYPATPWRLRWEENALLIFTFWWSEYKIEEDLKVKKIMKISNISNIFFIGYTILISTLYLYIKNNRSIF